MIKRLTGEKYTLADLVVCRIFFAACFSGDVPMKTFLYFKGAFRLSAEKGVSSEKGLVNKKKEKGGYRREAVAVRCGFIMSVFISLFISPGLAAGDGTGGFHDILSLHERAVDHDAELSAARKKRDAGLEKRVQGRAFLLPVIDLSAQWAVERQWAEVPDLSGEMGRKQSRIDQTVYQLRLSQPVVHVERFYEYRQAQAAASIAELEFMQASHAFRRRLVHAYLDVLRAREEKATVVSMLEAVKAQAHQAQSRQAAGLVSRIDAQEAQAEASRARVSLIRARAELKTRLRKLESIAGILPDRLLPLADHFDPKDHVLCPVSDFLEWGKRHNPRIRRLKAAEDQADYRRKSTRAAFFPAVNLNIAAGRDATRFDGRDGLPARPDDETDNVRVALQLSMPLFAGGSNVSQYREAAYQLGGAKEERRASAIENRRNIEVSYQNLISLAEAINASLLSVSVQEETLAATQRSFDAGLRDTVDVLRAQRAMFDARQAYEEARLDYIAELTVLYEQAGRLDRAFIVSVNHWLGDD